MIGPPLPERAVAPFTIGTWPPRDMYIEDQAGRKAVPTLVSLRWNIHGGQVPPAGKVPSLPWGGLESDRTKKGPLLIGTLIEVTTIVLLDTERKSRRRPLYPKPFHNAPFRFLVLGDRPYDRSVARSQPLFRFRNLPRYNRNRYMSISGRADRGTKERPSISAKRRGPIAVTACTRAILKGP